MFIALIVLHVIVSIILVLVVLVQSGRGAELGAAFGGIGQSTFGMGQATFITKLTAVLAAVFMATSLGLSLIAGERAGSSVLQPSTSASVPAPLQPAPVTPAPTATPGAPAAPVAPSLPQTAAPAQPPK